MNRGSLFERLGESEYNRFRRLVIANCGLKDVSEKLNIPNYLSVIKQCSKCAEQLFHSEVNNFFWIKKCPIHLIDLVGVCPNCNDRWPLADKLSSVKCNICGGRMSPDELSMIPRVLNLKAERIAEIEQVFGSNHHPALQSYKFSVVDRFNESMPRKGIVDTSFYPSFVAAQLELSKEEIAKFESYGIEFPRLKQLHFKWEECHVSSQELHAMDEYSIQGSIRKRIYIRATHSLNNCLPVTHLKLHLENESYCNSRNCPFCKTHRVLKATVKHENVDYFSRNKSIELDEIGSDLKLPNLAMSLVHFNHYRLPFKVSRLIYYLDLWAFINAVFYYFSNETRKTKSTKECENLILATPSKKYFCPIQIVENLDDGLVLYYPAFLPKMEFDWSHEFFDLPSVKAFD